MSSTASLSPTVTPSKNSPSPTNGGNPEDFPVEIVVPIIVVCIVILCVVGE
jgi:hypothetical protein